MQEEIQLLHRQLEAAGGWEISKQKQDYKEPGERINLCFFLSNLLLVRYRSCCCYSHVYFFLNSVST